jgi:hypothetical protein
LRACGRSRRRTSMASSSRSRCSVVIAATFYTMRPEMKRLAALLTAASAALLVLAPAALAHDGGQGWYGLTDDKVTTNAGFILIAFFPLFIFVMSMIQWRLDKRKERRKKVHKELAGDEQAWRGGW